MKFSLMMKITEDVKTLTGQTQVQKDKCFFNKAINYDVKAK